LQKGLISARITLMQKVENKKTKEEISVEDMFRVGAHYGYSKTRRHPSLASHIYAIKNKTDIINLEKTSIQLLEACEFIKNLGSKNKTILFVGTKPEAKEIIKEIAISLNMPYVNERWIGGTLSNFSEIKKRITELENYRKENKEGGLEKYTKKERVVMAKKMERLSRYYSGLIGLKKLPEALYIVDAKAENIAKMEAKKENVPIIALINSDSDIKNIDYPIVCNEAAIPSIKLFTQSILNSYKTGQMSIPPSVSPK
jgi:small subunit ribosomal protein S2